MFCQALAALAFEAFRTGFVEAEAVLALDKVLRI